MSDSNTWAYIGGLRVDLGRAEERIHALEGKVAVYGEMLDDLRNRVYRLEHGIPRPRRQYEDDEDDEALS
jgi:hypothetical protein